MPAGQAGVVMCTRKPPMTARAFDALAKAAGTDRAGLLGRLIDDHVTANPAPPQTETLDLGSAGVLELPDGMDTATTQALLDATVDNPPTVVNAKHRHVRSDEPANTRYDAGTKMVQHQCTDCGALLPWKKA